MGSPISPIVANLFMEGVSVRPSTLPQSFQLWLRYMDDNFSSNRQNTANSSYNTFITLTHTGPDNTLVTYVYKKAIHTDQYLHWDSHHNLSAKYSVFYTLTHSTQILCKERNTSGWLYTDESTLPGL